MEDRPQIQLGHAGLQRNPHRLQGLLGGHQRGSHQRHLLRALHRASHLHDLAPATELESLPIQSMDGTWAGSVNGHPPVAGPVFPHHGRQLRRPSTETAFHLDPRELVHPLGSRPDLVHQGVMACQECSLRKVEENHRTLRTHPEVTARIVGRPQGHVGCITRVADMYGVVEDDARIVEVSQAIPHPLKPVTPHRIQVRKNDAGGLDLSEGFGWQPYRMPVVRHGTPVLPGSHSAGSDSASGRRASRTMRHIDHGSPVGSGLMAGVSPR